MHARLISAGSASTIQAGCRFGHEPWYGPCTAIGYNPYFSSCGTGSIPCWA
ncbi:MAG: hypothetical protein HXS48_21935 [Theionarchaea archaeon]|nr:hypothetical protein [Theionarchaea archaeon]